ncbi:MAG TPA: carboxypeptidase-like regulatory domain-containing protein, partial [Pyrinomonadaceae bacterium]|nr:carboxypeptidase-like regulatory domain-containing protein [Pyrinomonadaceae bacterium]
TVPNMPTSTARIRVREADFAAPSGSSSANFTISSGPLAGGAVLSGRVLDQNGRAVSRAMVVLNDGSGTTRTAVSNPFGYFTFDDVQVGATYVVNVRHKRYRFEAQVINLTDSFAGLVFMAAD